MKSPERLKPLAEDLTLSLEASARTVRRHCPAPHPAEAGISVFKAPGYWIPAVAGMTAGLA